jgi:ketosteroid isomerase-like protein
MRIPRTATLLLLSLCFACAPPDAPVDLEAEAAGLMQLSREWSEIAGSGDIEATLAYWAEDAILMVPDLPPLRGKAAIREYVEAGADIPGFSVRWEPLEAHVAPSGDMAYLIERNQFTMFDSTGALVTQSNKGFTVWTRQPDGSWKNVVDMWNADPSAWERD